MDVTLRPGPALAAIMIASAAALPPIAAATPNRGVSAVILSQLTVDGHDHVLQQITVEPGGSTGWHWHDGTLFGVIRQGVLTHNLADCSLDGVYGPGDAITEPGGADHAHIGRNLGAVPVVLQVVYINPAGSPLSRDIPAPDCGYQ